VAIKFTVEADITLNFDKGEPVIRRKKDDLPRHVKGTAWWYTNSRNPELTGYYYSTKDTNYAIEFLRIRGQEHWYSLTRKRGPTGKTYHTTDGSK